MLDNGVLRQRARRQLEGGIFKPTWLKMMAVIIILDAILSVGASFLIGSLILVGPIDYATERIFANKAKNVEDVNFNRLIDGFTEDFVSVFLLGLLKAVFILLWSLLLIVPGIIKSYSYAMSSFIQQEQGNKQWRYCLDESKRLMQGNKWKLFCLDLSFIGWYLLGALALGVGVFFVQPYHQMARSNFYLELYYQNREQTEIKNLEQTQTDNVND